MKIALYQDHHHLPFWHRPTQPYAMFDEKEMASFRLNDPESPNEIGVPIHDTGDWPVLIGLHNLQIENLIAHVSYIFDLEQRTAKRTKRFWIQITIMPELFGEDELPVVVKDGKSQVIHLWGGDNETYHPTQLIKESVGLSDIWDSKFWTYFFEKMLKNERQNLEIRIQKAKNEVEKLEEVLKFIPKLV